MDILIIRTCCSDQHHDDRRCSRRKSAAGVAIAVAILIVIMGSGFTLKKECAKKACLNKKEPLPAEGAFDY